MFKPEYSIQSLLNMNIEENIYRRCIDEVKSPLQTFSLTHSTIDSGPKMFQNGSPQQGFSTVSSFNQIKHNSESRKRSMSRTRKKIFDDPLKSKSILKKGSQVGCWDMCMASLAPAPNNVTPFNEIKTSRSQHIAIKEYSPIEYRNMPKPLQKLHYENTNIPSYETEFIAFLLKIIPKLYLRNQLATHLYVNKSQLLQSLLTQPYKYQRSDAINSIFSSGKMNRIDRRFNSPNLNMFINKLTMTSNKPVDNYAEQQVVSTVRKIIDLLNDVEDDIKQFLSSDGRLKELQTIYQEMGNESFQRHKTLSLLMYQYLNKKGVSCRESNVDTLSYIWEDMNQRHYLKEEFVDQLVKNDIIVKRPTQSQTELQKELTRLGYTRNS